MSSKSQSFLPSILFTTLIQALHASLGTEGHLKERGRDDG